MGTVGCVPRMHRLIGMIGDHTLQNRNRTKCVCIMAASNNVIPAPIFIGINSSRNPETLEITGLPPEFTPYLIRGGSDKLVIIRGSLNH